MPETQLAQHQHITQTHLQQVSLIRSLSSPEIRVYRPRNPHLQSPPALFPPPQTGFSSSPQKRQREPSNLDSDSGHDDDPESQHYNKRTGAEPLRGTTEDLSLSARRRRDAEMRTKRETAQMRTALTTLTSGSRSQGATVLAGMMEGLVDDVRGRDAAGRLGRFFPG
jgi:hypothetical protein